MADAIHIYIATNAVNGKLYIGQTVDLKARRRQHRNDAARGAGKTIKFMNAIRKYGFESFRFEQFHTYATQDEADACEVELIELYETLNSNHGYNTVEGGRGGFARAAAQWGAAVRFVEKMTSDEAEQALFDKHSKTMRENVARLTHEQRVERMQPALAALTPEMQSENLKRRQRRDEQRGY